jgi:integrase/recombinase XerC
MAKAYPWFRASKNAWYVNLEGKQVSLAVKGQENKAEAVKAWHRLMSEAPKQEPKQEPRVSVGEVVDGFLADCESRKVKPTTLRVYRYQLLPFVEQFGKVKAEALTCQQAERYARQQEQWSDSSKNAFLGALVTAFRWAERSRLIERMPLQALRRPPKASRGADAVISEEEHERLYNASTTAFKPFLQLLWLTGARPGEIASITAENFDEPNGMVRLKEHKTAHKGKNRTIFLCAEAVALLKDLREKQGEGVLLRNGKGNAWTGNAVVKAMILTRQRAGLIQSIAYGYRHGFATTALANGIPDAQVSALLGHSGTAMLHKHYSHLTGQSQVLREALNKVR